MNESLAAHLVIRRYHVLGIMLGGLLLGNVSLFSRGGEDTAVQPIYRNRIALTFDDGPHPGYTERLLDILSRERVAATFFIVGKQAELHPGLLRLADRRGHEIASHTYHHPNLTTVSNGRVREELDDTRFLIERILDKQTFLFRPPGGRYDARTVAAAADGGYRMILWNVIPHDHQRPAAQVIYDRVMAQAKDGGVVLLHSGVEGTVEVLPRIINDLRARGYQFLTVTEMLRENLDPRAVDAWRLPAPHAAKLGRHLAAPPHAADLGRRLAPPPTVLSSASPATS